jgi:hypothetical protein
MSKIFCSCRWYICDKFIVTNASFCSNAFVILNLSNKICSCERGFIVAFQLQSQLYSGGGGKLPRTPTFIIRPQLESESLKLSWFFKLVRAFLKLRAPYSTAPHAASSGPVGWLTLVMMSWGPLPPEKICPGPANSLRIHSVVLILFQ